MKTFFAALTGVAMIAASAVSAQARPIRSSASLPVMSGKSVAFNAVRRATSVEKDQGIFGLTLIPALLAAAVVTTVVVVAVDGGNDSDG